MSNLNQARFGITLKFGNLSSGKTMTARLSHNDCEYVVGPDPMTLDLELPTRLQLTVSGKDMMQDTWVNADGKIAEDLHIQIAKVSLDGFVMDDIFLNQKINLVKEGGDQVTTCYLGFNGHVDFELAHCTVFQQVMAWRSVA